MAEQKEQHRRKKQDNQDPSPPAPSGVGNLGLWRWILAFLLIWAVTSVFQRMMARRAERVPVSYTVFKQQVRTGNVERVTLQGPEIRGEFESPYHPPAPEQADTERTKEGFGRFRTTRPPVEDPDLIPLLEEKGVGIEAKAVKQQEWIGMLLLMLPWLLLIGYFVYAGRKMRRQMGGGGAGGGPAGLFNIGQSKARRVQKSMCRDRYDDVAGNENAKRDLREIVDYLKDPGKFTALGAHIPKGVLLTGPPGTGKTLLARATAGEAEVPFFSISGSEFIEMFVGVGASRVRNMFKQAKDSAPAIIFIDEIDSIGRSRGTGLGGGHDEREQTLNQILSEMDGFEPHESVVVISATNRPDVLDPALTRPGRFDRRIVLEPPAREAREKILGIHAREVPLAEEVDLSNVAARTVGFSGADLRNLVNEAALMAGRRERKQVTTEDFEDARDKLMLGARREETLEEEEKRRIAWHESGHALLAELLEHTDPLEKVTIIPRGRALGVTEQSPEIERHQYVKDYLLDRICSALGGRAAEEVVFGDTSNGAASDLDQVTRIARHMVCRWGMSKKIGPMTLGGEQSNVFLGREITQQKEYSEETAKRVDDEVRRIVSEMEERAVDLLRRNRARLDALAQTLLEEETVPRSRIRQLLEETPPEGDHA
ncbi:ATP-dependent zinc metalloprotease FtsH [Kiritimatiella glycovorans]|uniref:ATP-dependent zinc metalloprotease FtsH n=1 Tax=Kiritimatiella glycovorans TaxID=1307763 RepID=A0A0G3EEY7_9BACT|nr:ATP-dependent zinc metalloprotease FtsH [Kiritimatiella glycovorans]AKJ64883.1 ATP-dependent zinc metalloprotease FtsH [Kiritimatiella glycovorans]